MNKNHNKCENELCEISSELNKFSQKYNMKFNGYFDDFRKTQKNLINAISSISESIKPFQDQLMKITNDFSKKNQDFFSVIKNLQLNSSIFQWNQDLIESLKGKPLSEEIQEKLSKRAKQFADYGIICPFNEPINDIYKIEITNEYVSMICDKYSSGESYEMIKKEFNQLPYKNEQQINEVFSCFEQGNYYACCSLLFAIIDREIISHQPHISEKKKRRNTYNKDLIDKKIANPDNENHYLPFLCKINFMHLLSYYYGTGDDFIDESISRYPVINRNFLEHGMTNRTITKNDCVKLFLFIYYLF